MQIVMWIWAVMRMMFPFGQGDAARHVSTEITWQTVWFSAISFILIHLLSVCNREIVCDIAYSLLRSHPSVNSNIVPVT